MGPTATLVPSWNIFVSKDALGELQIRCTHRFRRGGEPPSGHGCVNGFPPEPSMGGTHQVRSLPTKTSMAWSPLSGHGLLIECFEDTRNEIHAPSPQPAHKKRAHRWVNGCPRQPGKWIYAPSPQPAHKKWGGGTEGRIHVFRGG